MSNLDVKSFAVSSGIDTYNPPFSSGELKFVTLRNMEPRMNRLMRPDAFDLLQDDLNVAEPIRGFGMYSVGASGVSDLYAFGQTSVWRLDLTTGLFITTPVYAGFPDSVDPYVITPWYDCLYATKPGASLVKFQHDDVTEVVGGLGAKFGVIANSHLYLAGMTDGLGQGLLRTRWSDLNLPESVELNPGSSEADIFEIEPPAIKITGLTYQRGTPLIYTESAIWRARPIGYPGGFITEPLFPGLGCVYEYAAIQLREIDFFIGPDNFYMLNGYQPVPIGDDIWDYFINAVQTNLQRVFAYIDTRKNQVFWVFDTNGGTKDSVVYNYKEKKWSTRNPQSLTAFHDTSRVSIKGLITCDELVGDSDDLTGVCDSIDEGTERVVPQLVGFENQGFARIGTASASKVELLQGQFACEVESFDFFFDNPEEIKEWCKLSFQYNGGGTPTPQLRIGSRKSLTESVTWSSAITPVWLDGTLAGFFRTEGVGKFLRFKLTWNNSESNYISELLMVSITQTNDAAPITVK